MKTKKRQEKKETSPGFEGKESERKDIPSVGDLELQREVSLSEGGVLAEAGLALPARLHPAGLEGHAAELLGMTALRRVGGPDHRLVVPPVHHVHHHVAVPERRLRLGLDVSLHCC